MAECATYHYDSARSGWFQGSGANISSVAQWRKYEAVDLGSAVRGAPLFIENWVVNNRNHDLVFVAASDNWVYSFEIPKLLAGLVKDKIKDAFWALQLGNPSQSTVSNIFPPPIGVCSTPVLDPISRRMFVLVLEAHSVPEIREYFIYSLSLDTGKILQHAQVKDPGGGGRPTFDGTLLDQRGALNIVGARVYATFAALQKNDQLAYHGWVVGCNVNGLSDQVFFPVTRSSSPRGRFRGFVYGGGVWGPGGAAGDADGSLYIATGNTTYWFQNGFLVEEIKTYWDNLGGKHPADQGDFFEAVVRLGTSQELEAVDWYVPTDAQRMNDGTKPDQQPPDEQYPGDQDLGGSSPLLLPPINGHAMLVVTGKDGDVYLLNRADMGHWGGELWREHVFNNTNAAGRTVPAESKCAPAYYRSSSGQDYVFVIGSGRPGLVAYRVFAIENAWDTHWFQLLPQTGVAAPGQAVTAVWRNSDHLDLFMMGQDGHVWSTYFENNQWQPHWFQLRPETGVAAPGQPVTAVWRNADHLDLFMTGRDGHVWSTYFENNQWQPGWFQLRPETGVAAPGQPVTAVWRNPDHLDLFMTGQDGHVWSIYFENNQWQPGWFQLRPQTGTAVPGQPVTAVWRNPNHLDLFMTGQDGHVWSTYFENNQWQPGWFQLRPQTGTAAPAQPVTAVWRNPNHLDLFMTGQDGHVWSIYFENNQWQPGWFQLLPQTGTAVPGQPVTAVWRNPNHLDLFMTGQDGHVWSTYFENNQWQPHWFALLRDTGAAAPGQPVTAVWRNSDHLDLFMTGRDGHIWSIYFQGTFVANLQQQWLATGEGITFGDAPGSPTVMSTPGTPNEAVVWIVDDDVAPALRAFDALTGTEVYNSSRNQNRDNLGPTPHFAPITCAQSIVFVGTQTGFACYGPNLG